MPAMNVVREMDIDKPRACVYASLIDFKQWSAWSPWHICERECPITVAEDGRSYAWDGAVIGKGEIHRIAEHEPGALDYHLVFLKPWKSEAKVRFELREYEGGTCLSWRMNSQLPWFMFWMRSMMEAFIGMDYDRGLLMLKAYLETGSVPSTVTIIGLEQQPECNYIGIRRRVHMADIGNDMSKDFKALGQWFNERNLNADGQCFSITHDWNPVKKQAEYTAAFALSKTIDIDSVPENFLRGQRPASTVFTAEHIGPYHHLGNAWTAVMMRARNKVFRQNKKRAPFEIYVNNPETTEAAALKTRVCVPALAST